MKILFVTTGLPYPPDSGQRIPTYNIMKELSQRHEITLFSIIHNDVEKKYIKNLEQICRKIYTVILNLTPITEKVRLRDILSIFSRLPLSIKRRLSKEVKKQFLKVINEDKFDVIQFEHTAIGEYGKRVKNIPSILATRNIVSQILKRQFLNTENFVKRRILYHEYKKMYHYEINIHRYFTKILAVSKTDKEFFVNNGTLKQKIAIIPNGVNLKYYQPLSQPLEDTLLYTGDLDYYPNYDAVQYFYKQIFPLILGQKKVKFIQVGKKGLIESVVRDDINVELIGYVGDVRLFFQKSTILIVPIRIGSGTRCKILEAMAMGRPVVSTTVGCEGIDVTPGENIIIADSPEEFARQVVLLLENRKLQERLARAGRKLVEEKYNWKTICKRLEEVYQEIKEKAS